MAIVLNNITSGYNLAKINANFQNIEDYINDKLLARADTGVAGEAMMERALDMNGNKILNVFVDVNDANSLLTVGAADTRYYNVEGDTLTGPMNVNGQIVSGLLTPTASSQAAPKSYVDAVQAGLDDLGRRALRFPEVVPPMLDVAARANSLQGYNNLGNPVPIFSQTATADLAIQLAGTSGADLVGNSKKYFNVVTYGAVADYTVATNTPLTDSTNAFKAAIAAAIAVGGIVYIPPVTPGKAFYITDSLLPINPGPGALWRGATIEGAGIYASSIYCNTGSLPAIKIAGTSGFPSNIKMSGFSLYAHTAGTGIGLQTQGVCVYEIADVALYNFDTNLYISNASAAGIFSEFINCNRLWLQNGNTNIKFRRDGGDTSFHGINFNHCVLNNTVGQTGIDIGTGCVVYNADWQQITLFGAAGVQWILNNGARNGSETLFFEGDGTVTNNGSWSTSGNWRIQNSSGTITDTSTIPFTNDHYITPTTPVDPNFSAAGFSTVQATTPLQHNQAYRGIVRLVGPNAQGVGVVGFGSGTFENQGLAILSQATGSSINGLLMRYLMHLNGIKSYRPNWALSYAGGTAQLSINSTGRASGVMGGRSAGTISASGSPQTITISSLLPQTNQSYLISLSIQTGTASSKILGTFVGSYNTTSNTVCGSLGNIYNAGSEFTFAPSTGVVITSGGDLTITLTTSAAANYAVNVVGVGTY